MKAVANIKENSAKVKALKNINQCEWVGSTVHTNLNACLTALNLEGINSGWYQPIAIKIDGLDGIYMVNQDGSIFCEARIIKDGDKKFKIEYLSTNGWSEFENLYLQLV
ncbi:MAG: hypothetical protein WAT16_05025 [Saprospiraceae bacterium]|nr:hypothetical protein [Saprospiraceae bacterium]